MIQILSDALAERGYDTLTDVQQAVTAEELAGQDLLVSAQTGSGKTVGFGLAMARDVLAEDGSLGPAAAPLALVIAPTRELALQVKRELGWLYGKAGARLVSCVGGMDARDERRALERGAHIVVGTPGRLRDHLERGALDLESLQVAVLDEADEMLDLGFREDLEFILGGAPEERRTLLFSATVPPMIEKLAKDFQRDAQRISTTSGKKQHSDISYQVIRVNMKDSERAIFNMLRFHDAENAIIFANTRVEVARLTSRLANRGFQVVCLSGELTQQERTNALQAMRDGRAKVCVATDVAARGIDLPNLELVIHADLPTNTEALLHRSGRTGRAGRKGISALIANPKSAKRAERLLKWAKISAEWTEAPSAEDIQRRDEERLLADPLWAEETTPEQQEFATRLLEMHSAEQIAAAYLRLYRARLSAPEELGSPDERPERKERKEFGPSRWFRLSVGRNERAEPRWLLPMVCRSANIDKTVIGAIRVRQDESFIEIAEAAAENFLASLGDAAQLEDGIKVTTADGPPAPEPRQPRGDDRRGGGRDRGPREDRPRGDRFDRPKREDRPRREDRPKREERGPNMAAPNPNKSSYNPAPVMDEDAPRKPRAKKVWGDKPEGKKPYKSEGRGDFKGGKPDGKKSFGKPDGKKPYGKSEGGFGGKTKRDGDKPGFDKPRGKPAGKFGDKSKFGDKPRGDGPKGGKPARFNAADTSKRMDRPGGKRPAAGPRKGGDGFPRRPKG